MKQIKPDAIILDFGGVIIDINYQKPIEEFKKLGVDLSYSQAEQSTLFDDFETGSISPQKFREAIRKQSQQVLSDDQIDDAWNSILGSIPEHRVELLIQLKQKYPLYLLSNTNEIHIASFEEEMIREYGHHILEENMLGVYYSSRIGQRKPHAAAFHHVLHENGLIPQNTLFIDDSIQHVNGALKVGLNAHHLKGELKDLLQQLELL
ncbi:MAG: HAD family phosphatase [Flavobacteriales bacterium]|nr:HAD family phosphatase [Flavobacteriales bacterium]